MTISRLGIASVFLLISGSAVFAQNFSQDPSAPPAARELPNDQIREKWKEVLNANLVTIVSGSPSGSYLRIAHDISAVTSSGNRMRVIPMVGKGAVQNTRDIMFLRGVDMGLVNVVALDYFEKSGELGTNLKSQLAYIAPLFQDELHVLTRTDIKSFRELEGKRVNFSGKGSGAQLSARTIFNALGMKVQELNMRQAQAIEMIKRGELDATLCTCLKPLPAHARVKPEDGLHLIPVAYDEPFQALYLPATISHEDYPNLIPEGEVIETIAVQTMLAAYNWPPRHPRYARMERFVAAFFDSFDKLMQPPRHPRWKTVNLAGSIPGWTRFGPAQKWLDGNAGRRTNFDPSDKKMQAAFKAFLNEFTSNTSYAEIPPKQRDALYKEFSNWWKGKLKSASE